MVSCKQIYNFRVLSYVVWMTILLYSSVVSGRDFTPKVCIQRRQRRSNKTIRLFLCARVAVGLTTYFRKFSFFTKVPVPLVGFCGLWVSAEKKKFPSHLQLFLRVAFPIKCNAGTNFLKYILVESFLVGPHYFACQCSIEEEEFFIRSTVPLCFWMTISSFFFSNLPLELGVAIFCYIMLMPFVVGVILPFVSLMYWRNYRCSLCLLSMQSNYTIVVVGEAWRIHAIPL